MTKTPATSVADTPYDFKQGDRVRITKGRYEGEISEIEKIGEDCDGTPLYLIAVLLVYKGDEIERVESEVRDG
jgi:transcription antitermination factor NusG